MTTLGRFVLIPIHSLTRLPYGHFQLGSQCLGQFFYPLMGPGFRRAQPGMVSDSPRPSKQGWWGFTWSLPITFTSLSCQVLGKRPSHWPCSSARNPWLQADNGSSRLFFGIGRQADRESGLVHCCMACTDLKTEVPVGGGRITADMRAGVQT